MPRNDRTLSSRVASVSTRVRNLSPLAGGVLGAAKVVLGMRFSPNAVHTVHYRGLPIAFRLSDEQALKEVLIDEEYGFLADRLTTIDAPRILDIGAHIGTFALWATTVSSKVQITSVEADPATFDLLRRNFCSQQIIGRTLHRAAASSDGAVVRFSNSGPSMSHRVDATGMVEVSTISLGTLIDAAGGQVELAKIDVEGSEEALICANPEVLERIDALVIELHPALCDEDRVRAELVRHFGEIVEVGGRKSSKPLLYCTKSKLSEPR